MRAPTLLSLPQEHLTRSTWRYNTFVRRPPTWQRRTQRKYRWCVLRLGARCTRRTFGFGLKFTLPGCSGCAVRRAPSEATCGAWDASLSAQGRKQTKHPPDLCTNADYPQRFQGEAALILVSVVLPPPQTGWRFYCADCITIWLRPRCIWGEGIIRCCWRQVLQVSFNA